MNYRNAKYNQHGTIDCEYEHPEFGWIPFTASPTDTNIVGRHLHQLITRNGDIAEFVPQETEVLSLDFVKEEAKRQIDMAATAARTRFISAGDGLEMIYMLKAQEAEKFVDAGYPEENIDDYPFIKAEAEATEDTGRQAADLILSQRDSWLVAGALIEKERRSRKIVVDEQLSETGVKVAVQQAYAALEMIKP